MQLAQDQEAQEECEKNNFLRISRICSENHQILLIVIQRPTTNRDNQKENEKKLPRLFNKYIIEPTTVGTVAKYIKQLYL